MSRVLNTATSMPALENKSFLEECLASATTPMVIQDGEAISPERIRQMVGKLSPQLAPYHSRRIALSGQRADTIIAALLACQSFSCDLLLLREERGVDDPVWQKSQVAAVMNDSLELKPTSLPDDRIGTGGVLLMTSGTTAAPKIAFHFLEALLSRVVRSNAKVEPGRWLLTFHPASFAGLQVLLTTFVTRSQLIALNRPSIADLVAAALEFKPSHVSGTPTFWRAFLMSAGEKATSVPLRQITIGGEAVDQTTLDQLHTAFPNARLTHIYASTEVGAVFAVRDGKAGFPAEWLKFGTEGTQLRIRDGVLEILSPRAMKGYIGDSAPRNRTDDGWIVTGDLVEATGERVLFRGRTDSVINVGGAKVSPEQIESVLLEMPIIKEARVYGIANPMIGAVVAADIVLQANLAEDAARRQIFSFVQARLESYKIPRLFKFVNRIAVNAAGKKERQ